MTDLNHWENRQHNEKFRQHNDSTTNETMSPTSLSPIEPRTIFMFFQTSSSIHIMTAWEG